MKAYKLLYITKKHRNNNAIKIYKRYKFWPFGSKYLVEYGTESRSCDTIECALHEAWRFNDNTDMYLKKN